MVFSSILLAASLTITAGGDAFMVQGFPKGFKLDTTLTEWIGSGDARLVNFETVVNDGTCRPAAWSGGTWSSMDPSVLPDFLAFGFNGCGCANNHSLDFSQDALFLTMKTLKGLGMPFATDARCFVSCGVPVVNIGHDHGDSHAATEWAKADSIDLVTRYLTKFILDEYK